MSEYEQDLSSVERAIMYRHVVIAVFCLPVYMAEPVLAGLILGPYVMWMVFAAKPALLLPLMIHMIHGSQQRYLALLACFIYSLLHVEAIARRKMLMPFILYLLSLPFFIWYTVMRYRVFGGGIGAGGTFEGLGYYFGISAFFWGLVAVRRIPPIVMRGFVMLCFINIVTHFLFFMKIPFTRFLFWSLPFLVALAFWNAFISPHVGARSWGVMGSIALLVLLLGFLGMGEMPTTFTILGNVMLSVIVLVFAKFAPKMLWLLAPVVVLPLLTIWMFHTIDSWYVNERGRGSSIAYNDIQVRDLESLRYKLFRKTMTDRAPVWYASWDAVKKQFERDPIWVDVEQTFGDYSFTDNLGRAREVTMELAAHNMLLEMMRLYGLYGGLGIYLLYLIIPSMRKVRESLRRHIATPYAPILACCIGHIIIGGQTGQYPISPQFTIYLFGLMGVCVGRLTEKDAIRYYPLLDEYRGGIR